MFFFIARLAGCVEESQKGCLEKFAQFSLLDLTDLMTPSPLYWSPRQLYIE